MRNEELGLGIIDKKLTIGDWPLAIENRMTIAYCILPIGYSVSSVV